MTNPLAVSSYEKLMEEVTQTIERGSDNDTNTVFIDEKAGPEDRRQLEGIGNSHWRSDQAPCKSSSPPPWK
jgi:hypothetical protein